MVYGILVLVLIGIVVLLGRDVVETFRAYRCGHVSKAPALSSVCEEESQPFDQVHLPPMPHVTIKIRVAENILMGEMEEARVTA